LKVLALLLNLSKLFNVKAPHVGAFLVDLKLCSNIKLQKLMVKRAPES
jgi:hypothetical protein